MNQFFVAHFNNGYSVEVYAMTNKDNSPCDFHLVPCGLDGKPHSVVPECEVKAKYLATTLDSLQFEMHYLDDRIDCRLDEEIGEWILRTK